MLQNNRVNLQVYKKVVVLPSYFTTLTSKLLQHWGNFI